MRTTPIMLVLSTLLAISVTAQADPVADKITNYNTVKSRTAKTRIDLSTLTTRGGHGGASTSNSGGSGEHLSQVNTGVSTLTPPSQATSPLSPVLSTAELSAAQLTKFRNLGYTPLATGSPLVQAADAYGPERKSYSDAQITAVLGSQWDRASLNRTLDDGQPTTAQWDTHSAGTKVFDTVEHNLDTAALLHVTAPTSTTTTAAGLRFQGLTNDIAAVQQMANDIYAKHAADYFANVLTTTSTDGVVAFKEGTGQVQYELMLKKTKALLQEIASTRIADLVAQYYDDMLTLRASNNPKLIRLNGVVEP